ncbi:MAG: ABC transporter permease [Thiohalomonadaceae bacterium]
MMLKRLLAVFVARNKEFLRDRAALGWNLLFPVLIVAGFAFAFSGEPAPLYKVGVVGHTPQSGFFSTPQVQFIAVDDLAVAVTKVERHRLDLLVDATGGRYWVNDESPRGQLLERLLLGSGGSALQKQAVSGRIIRYVDWLIPGVLGMNIMFSALYGVGYVIVRYRKNGVLKRLKATPLSAIEFLTAQIVSRLWLIVAVVVVVFFGTHLFVDFAMYGDYLALFIAFAMGGICMISMGLVIAARIASEELAEGLLNLISWPMMFLSGVWFSLEGTHPLVQQLAQAFPLTHMIDAARAVMLDGASLAAIAPQLGVLLAMTVGFLAVGAWLFRWE